MKNMKSLIKYIVYLMLIGIVTPSIAQVKISDVDNNAPAANAILQLQSFNKGFLPPKVRINSLTSIAPLTATSADSGMLVYSVGGSVTDGYYVWNGSQWNPFTTGVGGVNVVKHISDTTLTKTETFVVAHDDITITLPSITAADNGLAITVKNIGSHTDIIRVARNTGATIDGKTDTIKLYRWKARTFIAYNGNWLRREKDIDTESIYQVGKASSWTTITEMLEFLSVHMESPSTVNLDGGYYDLPSTQTVDLPYALTIQGPSYGQATIEPEMPGFAANTALFDCISEVSFKMIAFDCNDINNASGYGTHSGENALNLVTPWQYHEIKDCTFERFYNAINMTSNVDIWLFESDLLDCKNAGVELNALSSNHSDAISFFTSESSFSNCGKGISLTAADSAKISVQNCTFECSTGQYGLYYNTPTPITNGFKNIQSLFFTNNTWNNIGTFVDSTSLTAATHGFNFKRSDGRDANVEIENNAGVENKNPKCKINVVNNGTSVRCSNTGTWYKPTWTNSSIYTVNWDISLTAGAGNRFTFLPTNTRDIFIIVSGNVSVNGNNRTLNIGIVKRGASGTRYGETTLRTTTSGQAYQFSTTIYIPNVIKNDYFELWVNDANTSGFDDVTFQDINIFVNAQ
jgi:hypothetical protein